MSSTLDIPSTGSGGFAPRAGRQQSGAVVPLTIPISGGFTCASVRDVPIEFPDATSANVIDLVRNLARPHEPMPAIRAVGDVLDHVKRSSGLTWGVIAAAVGVAPRAIHNWREGGGISTDHEDRLRHLDVLVDSLDTGLPEDVRIELTLAGTTGSLLERLQAGESPAVLVPQAPWRQRAAEALRTNLSELANDDGVLDEDFVFLLHFDDEQVQRFASLADRALADPRTTRRAWDDLIEQQFAAVSSMASPAELPDEPFTGAEPDELRPLFTLADLGIPLGVGAIASRRPLHDGS
jgi:hypothetical protein